MITRNVFGLLVCVVLAACNSTAPQDTPPARVSVSSSDHRPAKELFGPVLLPSSQPAEAFGSYAKGCMAGGAELAETGPTWQAMRLSRNRNWGQPVLVDFLEDLSRKAAAQPGWNGIYVGDMSQPRGGPMSSGHASHQIGLDADIWMLPATRLDLTEAERESLSSISMRRSAGAFVNDSWTPQHHEILKAAASDPRVARIFVFPGAKVQMCKDETGDRAWLRKIRPWWGHHYHFHVRLSCPAGDKTCVDQAPPPAGDGCDDAQEWVDNILNPPPPDPNAKPAKPKPPITLATLPAQCSSVLSSR
ncbi:penicillin-insensitive murein endopeptidase [Celeribacter litoreus]|uniref:penicillin-insensitive murein endopeptidase n=1 Tax=Celeribacter litoreus TaxID=2876714 RepID=UPI001CCF49B4|nr:penicillin-insensitive murein endopeptidase [Celeribacter litoreus]MCA0042056.1 penicillin-insensitive murein endopeptidase [Celeribacter litoreus]